MTPEEAVADILTQVFPGSQVNCWQDNMRMYTYFRFRLVVGAKVWGLERAFPEELLHKAPELVAREMATDIRQHMEKELGAPPALDPWPGEPVEEIYEFGSSKPVMRISPLTGQQYRGGGGLGFKDGWYDTDQRRRDEARVLELARMETERQEEEKAKASILDTIAKKAMKGD